MYRPSSLKVKREGKNGSEVSLGTDESSWQRMYGPVKLMQDLSVILVPSTNKDEWLEPCGHPDLLIPRSVSMSSLHLMSGYSEILQQTQQGKHFYTGNLFKRIPIKHLPCLEPITSNRLRLNLFPSINKFLLVAAGQTSISIWWITSSEWRGNYIHLVIWLNPNITPYMC